MQETGLIYDARGHNGSVLGWIQSNKGSLLEWVQSHNQDLGEEDVRARTHKVGWSHKESMLGERQLGTYRHLAAGIGPGQPWRGHS